MADFPAMPFWTDRYLSDTRHLTRDQHGAYILLLLEAWRRPGCSLPDDDIILARLSCSTPEEWTVLKPVIMAFWKLDGRSKTWTQKGQMKERSFLDVKRASNRDKAIKRWKQTKKEDATAMPGACPEDAPTPTPTLEKETPNGVSKKNGFRLPENWFLPAPWGEWAEGEGWLRSDIKTEAEKFRDFWHGKTGANATKLDWQATWRNWMRNSKCSKAPRVAA